MWRKCIAYRFEIELDVKTRPMYSMFSMEAWQLVIISQAPQPPVKRNPAGLEAPLEVQTQKPQSTLK